MAKVWIESAFDLSLGLPGEDKLLRFGIFRKTFASLSTRAWPSSRSTRQEPQFVTVTVEGKVTANAGTEKEQKEEERLSKLTQ